MAPEIDGVNTAFTPAAIPLPLRFVPVAGVAVVTFDGLSRLPDRFFDAEGAHEGSGCERLRLRPERASSENLPDPRRWRAR